MEILSIFFWKNLIPTHTNPQCGGYEADRKKVVLRVEWEGYNPDATKDSRPSGQSSEVSGLKSRLARSVTGDGHHKVLSG